MTNKEIDILNEYIKKALNCYGYLTDSLEAYHNICKENNKYAEKNFFAWI